MTSTRRRVSLPVVGQVIALALLAGLAVVLFRWHGLDAPRVEVGTERLAAAVLAVLFYAAFCGFFVPRGARTRKQEFSEEANVVTVDELLVVHASQTGTAEALAARTAETLRSGRIVVRSLRLGDLDGATLARSTRVLFVVSTTGEGDAPDDAYRFMRDTMQDRDVKLAHLRFGLLSLGDSAYQTFCGFGRALDHWLHEHGATPLFDTVEVDDGDEGALRHWQHHLGQIGGDADAADWSAPAYIPWRLVQRRVLNAGSPGAAAVWVRIEPLAAHSHWQAGDIVEILPGPPGSDHPHREYSIASIEADGAIELLVRQTRHADGTPGLGSGWLIEQAEPGGDIALRVRRNASFHAPEDDRPMILIGNGTGIAGLRAHLKERIVRGRHRNWLLFGERTRAHDLHFGEELERWRAKGQLSRLDLAFSRDEPAGRYVQQLVEDTAVTLREWIANGAAIYVCGSLRGMAPGVDAALAEVLGSEGVEQLRIEGRYRRDVY